MRLNRLVVLGPAAWGPSDGATKRYRGGRTLLQVLAGVVALLLPFALFWPRANVVPGESGAEIELARTAIGVVCAAIEKYKLETGHWPDAERGLAVLTDGHAAPTAPYYVRPGQLFDPWDRAWTYRAPGPGGEPPEVMSYGRDGAPGGEGADADIRSPALD